MSLSANDDQASTEVNESVEISVLANDEGLGKPPYVVTITNNPGNGQVAVNVELTISYTPDQDFVGQDVFQYQVCNDLEECSQANVYIDVLQSNEVPLAAAVNAATNEDQPVTIDVLANDSGLANGPIDVSILEEPSHGLAAVNPEQTIQFTPQENYNGSDSFRYQVCDADDECSDAGVNITINPVNDPPVAANDAATTVRDTSVPVNVLANDTDPDEDILLLQSFQTPTQQGSSVIRLDNGTPDDLSDDRLQYTPAPGYMGADTFTYTVSDGSAADTAQVTITVEAPDTTPVANDDTYTTGYEETLIVLPDSGVLQNDIDPEGDTLTTVLVSLPQSGTLSLASNGSFSYTPMNGFSGPDRFTYQARDADSSSNTAIVTITVKAAPLQLTASDDFYQIGQDTPLIVAAPGVLGNDNDGNLTGISAWVDTQPSSGQLALNLDGSFTYTPDAGFIGPDSFTYRAMSTDALTAHATVEIDVLDTVKPTITWLAPVGDGESQAISDGFVRMEVSAEDNLGIEYIRFYRWDALVLPDGAYFDIAIVDSAPFSWDLDTSILNDEWNNIFAKAYDAAGNESNRQWIWLYKSAPTKNIQIFLPAVRR